MFRILSVSLVLLLLHPAAQCSGKSSGQIRSIAVSPDGKLIAVDFKKKQVID